MRVLVTRPLHDARRTAAELAALGHEPIVAPLLDVIGSKTNIDALVERLAHCAYDAVVITSAQTFHFLRGASLAPLSETPLFVVGARSAKAAVAAGFWGRQVIAANGAELAGAIIAALPRGARALYLAGADRKKDLERELAAAGVIVEVVETYAAARVAQMPAAACDAFWDGRVEAVLHFSRRSAEIFVDLATSAGVAAAAARARHCAISTDAAAPLRGFTDDIRVAVSPDAASLYRMLE